MKITLYSLTFTFFLDSLIFSDLSIFFFYSTQLFYDMECDMSKSTQVFDCFCGLNLILMVMRTRTIKNMSVMNSQLLEFITIDSHHCHYYL